MTFVVDETWLEKKKITNGSNMQFLFFLIRILWDNTDCKAANGWC